MYIVAIAWIYVVLMMSVVEALSTQGTVLGAVFTFLLYGLLPLSVVLYILGTPSRRRALRAAEAAEAAETRRGAAPVSEAPDGGSHAPGLPIAPKGEER